MGWQLSQMSALNEALSEELATAGRKQASFSTGELDTMRQGIEKLRSGVRERTSDDFKAIDALRLEKKMSELEQLQQDNLSSASLLNWQKWRASEGKLRVSEKENDTLRHDLDTANRWIGHLEEGVRHRANTLLVGGNEIDQHKAAMVNLKLDLGRTTNELWSPTAKLKPDSDAIQIPADTSVFSRELVRGCAHTTSTLSLYVVQRVKGVRGRKAATRKQSQGCAQDWFLEVSVSSLHPLAASSQALNIMLWG